MTAPTRIATATAATRQRFSSSTSLLDVDDLMFETSGWFAIDAGNQRVPRVRVPSLRAGLDLVGQGKVASIVGRLRDQVRVVDVDLEGERGYAVAELLARWAHDRGVWSLVRPSGGADGRCHVFVVVAATRPDTRPDARNKTRADTRPAPGAAVGGLDRELEEYVAQLRGSFKTAAAAIDLRRSRHVRPLSAPHRLGGCPRPTGELRGLLRALRSTLQAAERHTARPTATTSTTVTATGTPPLAPATPTGVQPLVPRPRPRRELPEPWTRYLATGTAPEVGGVDRSRSTIEAITTAHLVRAGHDADSAWATITAAHPQAMTRARASRRRWTAWVWNRAVTEDHVRNANSPRRGAGPQTGPPPAVAAAVAAARAHLVDDIVWRLPVRRRRAVLLVGHHLLDRIARTAPPDAGADEPGALRVPVPERDLVLDTGLRDRKTIRAALRLLDGDLGRLHRDAWNPARRETTSFEFEISPAANETTPPTPPGVRQIPPPSSHTPSPAPPPGTWTRLTGPAHSLWRALLAAPAGLPAEAATTAAALTETPDQVPSAAHLRSTTAALDQLAAAGLAACDPAGVWTASSVGTLDIAQSSASAQSYRDLEQVITRERQAYRAATGSRSQSWSLARARAIKADHARQRSWWHGLDPHEQRTRRLTWTNTFHTLPINDQEAIKARLAGSRVAAGIDEAERHAAWIANLSPDEFVHRSVTRQALYASWPPPQQQAAAAAWERHRNRYGIPRATTTAAAMRPDRLHAALTPDSRAERDHQQLQLATTADAAQPPGSTAAS